MFFVVENLKNFDIQFFKQKGRRFKGDKFKKFLTLLNVYVDLYLFNMVREYEIMMNLSVFVEELKYKYNNFFNIYFLTYIDC